MRLLSCENLSLPLFLLFIFPLVPPLLLSCLPFPPPHHAFLPTMTKYFCGTRICILKLLVGLYLQKSHQAGPCMLSALLVRTSMWTEAQRPQAGKFTIKWRSYSLRPSRLSLCPPWKQLAGQWPGCSSAGNPEARESARGCVQPFCSGHSQVSEVNGVCSAREGSLEFMLH